MEVGGMDDGTCVDGTCVDWIDVGAWVVEGALVD